MSSRIEARATITNCNRCDEPIIEARCDGMTVRLSRFSVPWSDARILGKYGRLTFNVWPGAAGLYVSYWHPSESRPDKGRLYTVHFCHARR
jgi:hypothetical protein